MGQLTARVARALMECKRLPDKSRDEYMRLIGHRRMVGLEFEFRFLPGFILPINSFKERLVKWINKIDCIIPRNDAHEFQVGTDTINTDYTKELWSDRKHSVDYIVNCMLHGVDAHQSSVSCCPEMRLRLDVSDPEWVWRLMRVLHAFRDVAEIGSVHCHLNVVDKSRILKGLYAFKSGAKRIYIEMGEKPAEGILSGGRSSGITNKGTWEFRSMGLTTHAPLMVYRILTLNSLFREIENGVRYTNRIRHIVSAYSQIRIPILENSYSWGEIHLGKMYDRNWRRGTVFQETVWEPPIEVAYEPTPRESLCEAIIFNDEFA